MCAGSKRIAGGSGGWYTFLRLSDPARVSREFGILMLAFWGATLMRPVLMWWVVLAGMLTLAFLMLLL